MLRVGGASSKHRALLFTGSSSFADDDKYQRLPMRRLQVGCKIGHKGIFMSLLPPRERPAIAIADP
jgi:hypothetical protein